VSDGGEDQGAEEVTVGQKEGEESSRPFWKRAVSRERLFLFSANESDGPVCSQRMTTIHTSLIHLPAHHECLPTTLLVR